MTIDTSRAGQPAATAAEAVQASVRQHISEGRLLPGQRLVDQALAEEFGVSRNTVREAMRLLAADGLVASVRNAGYSVRTLTTGDVHDIYTARRLLETGAILKSASAPDALLADVDQAASASEQHVLSGEWGRAATASLDFHRAVVRMAGSTRVNAFFHNLVAQLRLAFAVMPDESAFQIQWVGRDRQIADLILAGRRDEATALMNDYLNDSETQIIDGVRAAERARH